MSSLNDPTISNPASSVQPPKGWFARNWLWLFPVGCALPVLLCGGCFASVFMIVFGAIKSTVPYQSSVARATGDENVQQLLGTPVEAGFFVTGNIEVQNNSGKANLSIPISGPKDSATLNVVAKRENGQWIYSVMQVIGENGLRIDLSTEPSRVIVAP